MRFQKSVVASVLAIAAFGLDAHAFTNVKLNGKLPQSVVNSAVMEAPTATETGSESISSLTNDIVSKLRFREAQRELSMRDLDHSGTLSAMKNRLRTEVLGISATPLSAHGGAHDINGTLLDEAFSSKGINFQDNSDPDFEFNDLVREIREKSDNLQWKGAVRKLRKLTRRFGQHSQDARTIPGNVYESVLRACMEDRLHGARAAESARKIMELMVEDGYAVPSDIVNSCVKNSLGGGPDASHDGFAGIDTALAMLAAGQHSTPPAVIKEDTSSKLIASLANNGSLEEALASLRELVVEQQVTPTLELFADIAFSAVTGGQGSQDPEQVMTVLAYAKAAGYELDNIASTVDGRRLLAAGVIASEKMNNAGLGLRFLTAASKAQGCEPDRGDALVANLTPGTQRAATILHREAINRATKDLSWKLSVKLLEIMLERGLTPSPSVWRNVVTCCAKAEKSRKATSLLLQWVNYYKQGRADKPSLRIFNTVVNACEVCGEEELTVGVLDVMKETHDTEGNLITFNIALKRLAKLGNTQACEGIIIGMLQNNIEPSVVTYTTAIAACVATEPKRSDLAVEWIKRMRSRRVQPNVMTYNTAFASCLDGTLGGSKRASDLAKEMVADVQKQVDSGILEADDYTNVIPNFYTRTLARQVMKQLKDNWTNNEIDRRVAKETLRVPLLQLVEFLKSDLSEMADKQKDMVQGLQTDVTKTVIDEAEEELEYSPIVSAHRAAAV